MTATLEPRTTSPSPPGPVRTTQWLALAAAVAFVLWLTMFAPPAATGEVHGPIDTWVPFRAVEMTLNVALFVPLGLVLGWIGRPRWLVGAVALTVAVEVTQLWLPRRESELVDVVTNTIGAAVGYALVAVASRWWVARRASRRAGASRGDATTTDRP